VTTAVYTITANNRDWQATVDGTTVNSSAEGSGAGQFITARSNTNAGARRNMGFILDPPGGSGVPQGATVNTAVLKLRVENLTRDDANLDIFGLDEDNPADWSSSRRPLTGDVTFTSASVSWVAAGLGVTQASSPDIAAVIQEIVDRGGYTSASKIGVICAGKNIATDHDVSCLAFEGGTGTYAELEIDYTVSVTAIPYAVLRQLTPLN
jgi:hypothetical protein